MRIVKKEKGGENAHRLDVVFMKERHFSFLLYTRPKADAVVSILHRQVLYSFQRQVKAAPRIHVHERKWDFSYF